VLVDPNDPNEIAAALNQLLDDPDLARDLAQRGRERAAAYTWERTGEMLEDAYRAGIGVAA
jgi:glycosyltransferase involved in cell wall biosynthesis